MFYFSLHRQRIFMYEPLGSKLTACSQIYVCSLHGLLVADLRDCCCCAEEYGGDAVAGQQKDGLQARCVAYRRQKWPCCRGR